MVDPISLNVKIIDFGLSKKLKEKNLCSIEIIESDSESEDEFISLSTPIGLKKYRAPEVLSHSFYKHKIDVWMIGLILFTLLTNEYLSTKK